jgi:hypothetical protein
MDKERANFCGYFEPATPPASLNEDKPSADALLAAAADLFGND